MKESLNQDLASLNIKEREKAGSQSEREFKDRVSRDPSPSDDERRIGAYKEMLEPQIRDAILLLTRKGYLTIDSGYDGRRYQEGIQYIGFEKGMIDASLIPIIESKLDLKIVKVEMEFSNRDFLLLKPKIFINLEQWKKIWDEVVSVFPDKGVALPFRDRFIDKMGH